jgi:hypothetical protein
MGEVMNIIELAKQANGEPARPGGVDWSWGELEAFAALVAAQEREACAKIADVAGPYQCADLIRARGTT